MVLLSQRIPSAIINLLLLLRHYKNGLFPLLLRVGILFEPRIAKTSYRPLDACPTRRVSAATRAWINHRCVGFIPPPVFHNNHIHNNLNCSLLSMMAAPRGIPDPLHPVLASSRMKSFISLLLISSNRSLVINNRNQHKNHHHRQNNNNNSTQKC